MFFRRRPPMIEPAPVSKSLRKALNSPDAMDEPVLLRPQSTRLDWLIRGRYADVIEGEVVEDEL